MATATTLIPPCLLQYILQQAAAAAAAMSQYIFWRERKQNIWEQRQEKKPSHGKNGLSAKKIQGHKPHVFCDMHRIKL